MVENVRPGVVDRLDRGPDILRADNPHLIYAAISGFGHRFHPVDPRAPRLMALVDDAMASGGVAGRIRQVAGKIEARIARPDRPMPTNIDGATAGYTTRCRRSDACA